MTGCDATITTCMYMGTGTVHVLAPPYVAPASPFHPVVGTFAGASLLD
eukprot:CAMPEP_0196665396 /NCGR_PEP_ID=MMETSP1086-20130531/60940_1 /TAXON_ID=77921 /ORGANISM="Cyanoptyche  gloeocystis , Strain SAG4.97" /LENGTH=47 /DNA_ID= /DNA_START= /DNA_END= /DNA_ORIENTATION=